MHEMALAESVMQIVEETARKHAAAVRAVWLEIGRLSHVEPEALRFAFDVVKRDGPARDARLEIVATDGTAWCMKCSEAGDACAPWRRVSALRQLSASSDRRRRDAGQGNRDRVKE